MVKIVLTRQRTIKVKILSLKIVLSNIEDKTLKTTNTNPSTADAEHKRFDFAASAPYFETENEVQHKSLYPKIKETIRDYCN